MSSSSEIWTTTKLLQWTTERFTRAQIPEPRVDAEHLLCLALNCSRIDLYLNHAQPIDAVMRTQFRTFVQRRLAHEPVAYITGHRGFHALDLDLLVDRRVLIPRPETEHLVDWMLEFLKPPPAPLMNVLDIGTGSGAIALAIKHARSDVEVSASDLSLEALEVAKNNAERTSLVIHWIHSDLLAQISRPAQGFMAISANLPYIPSAEINTLQPEIYQFEPHQALDGGVDGLHLIRRLIEECTKNQILAKTGRLFLEVGQGQASAVGQLLQANGFVDIATRKDLNGIERVISGQWIE